MRTMTQVKFQSLGGKRLIVKDIQKVEYQKSLVFSQEHINERLKSIKGYIKEPLEQKQPNEWPCLSPDQQKIYRQDLKSNKNYCQFEKQALNLFRTYNYTSQFIFHDYGQVLSVLNQLLSLGQTNHSMNYADAAYNTIIWDKAPKALNAHSVTLIDLIQTLYLQIDLQLYRLFSTIRQDIALNKQKQFNKFLEGSIRHSHQTLHILTATFYQKGAKDNIEYLMLLKNNLTLHKAQYLSAGKQITDLQRKAIKSKLDQFRSRNSKTLGKNDIVQAMSMRVQSSGSRYQPQQVRCFKENQLRDILSQKNFRRVLNSDQPDIIQNFVEEILKYRLQLKAKIQEKIKFHTPQGQNLSPQIILLIIQFMVKYLVLLQSFGLYPSLKVQLFTLNPKRQNQFIEKYIKSRTSEHIHFLQKLNFIKAHVKQFCQIWFTPKTLGNNTQCLICLRFLDQSQFYSIFKCSHTFCIDCLNNYFTQKINLFELPLCPYGQCPQGYVHKKSKFFKYLSKSLKQKFQKIQRFHIVSKNPRLKLCPKQNCEGIIEVQKVTVEQKKKTKISCPKCQNEYCSICMMKFHEQQCDLNELNFLQNNLRYRQCSNCKAIVQRKDGCPHMTCLCKNQFCYYCGERWSEVHKRQCKNLPEEQIQALRHDARMFMGQQRRMFDQFGIEVIDRDQEGQVELDLAMIRQMIMQDDDIWDLPERILVDRRARLQQLRRPVQLQPIERQLEWRRPQLQPIHRAAIVLPLRRLPLLQIPQPMQPIREPEAQQQLMHPPRLQQSEININLDNSLHSIQNQQPQSNKYQIKQDKQPQQDRSSYCLPLFLLKQLKSLDINWRQQQYGMGLRIMIWTSWVVLALASLFALPMFVISVIILEGILIVVGWAIYACGLFRHNPKCVALGFVLFPVTALIAIVIALINKKKYKQYRTAFNQKFQRHRC